MEIKPQNSSLLENDYGELSIVEKWKLFPILSLRLGHNMHFSGMRNAWVGLRKSSVGLVTEAWEGISPYSELIFFLSWVCSGKMQASADLYLTEATDHAVKGKADHYLVKVYWVGSTEVKSFRLLPSLCLCFIEFDHDFHSCPFLKRTCIRSWTLKYNSLDSNFGPDSVGVSGEVILPSSELQCSLL